MTDSIFNPIRAETQKPDTETLHIFGNRRVHSLPASYLTRRNGRVDLLQSLVDKWSDAGAKKAAAATAVATTSGMKEAVVRSMPPEARLCKTLRAAAAAITDSGGDKSMSESLIPDLDFLLDDKAKKIKRVGEEEDKWKTMLKELPEERDEVDDLSEEMINFLLICVSEGTLNLEEELAVNDDVNNDGHGDDDGSDDEEAIEDAAQNLLGRFPTTNEVGEIV